MIHTNRHDFLKLLLVDKLSFEDWTCDAVSEVELDGRNRRLFCGGCACSVANHAEFDLLAKWHRLKVSSTRVLACQLEVLYTEQFHSIQIWLPSFIMRRIENQWFWDDIRLPNEETQLDDRIIVVVNLESNDFITFWNGSFHAFLLEDGALSWVVSHNSFTLCPCFPLCYALNDDAVTVSEAQSQDGELSILIIGVSFDLVYSLVRVYVRCLPLVFFLVLLFFLGLEKFAFYSVIEHKLKTTYLFVTIEFVQNLA